MLPRTAQSKQTPEGHSPGGLRAWLGLIGCWSVIAAIWLVLLPWWARRPAIQARIHQLDQQGIDPSAMFYTELEAMSDILKKLPAAPGRSSAPTRLDRVGHTAGACNPKCGPR